MSLIPAFEIGVWNAWILMTFLFVPMIPARLINKEAINKVNEGWASKLWSKTDRRLALSTHVILGPLTIIYSIFLPLKLGTIWFYVGIPICFLALVMSIMVGINIAKTDLDNEPITKGIYRILRHPMYLSGFLLYLGVSIACASWIFILCALAWLIIWHIAVRSEESYLLEKYGDSYREYMNRTPRWIGVPKSG